MEMQLSSDTGWVNKIAQDSSRLAGLLSRAKNEHSNIKLRLLLLDAGAIAQGLSTEIEYGLKQRRANA